MALAARLAALSSLTIEVWFYWCRLSESFDGVEDTCAYVVVQNLFFLAVELFFFCIFVFSSGHGVKLSSGVGDTPPCTTRVETCYGGGYHVRQIGTISSYVHLLFHFYSFGCFRASVLFYLLLIVLRYGCLNARRCHGMWTLRPWLNVLEIETEV
jgi:hypothetical protein